MPLLPAQIRPNLATIIGPAALVVKLEGPIRKLHENLFPLIAERLQQTPFLERVAQSRRFQLPPRLKEDLIDRVLRLMQPEIIQRLQNAQNIDESLIILQDIKSLCLSTEEGQDEAVYSSGIFHTYIKPIFIEAQTVKNSLLFYKTFQTCFAIFVKDPAWSEIFVHWFVCQVANQEELNLALSTESGIRQIKIYYKIENPGVISLAEALKVNQTLVRLSLDANSIGAQGAQSLAEALKMNHTLTSLDLEYNSIGDQGVQLLAEALKENQMLTDLALKGNNITAQGTQSLAEALKVNRTLTSLSLRNNGIGDQGAQLLADALKVNHALTSLYIGDNGIGVEGARLLAEALKENHTLTSFELRDSEIGVEGARALAEALKVNQTLTRIHLGLSNFIDIDKKQIRQMDPRFHFGYS